jgi:hypothetical protein
MLDIRNTEFIDKAAIKNRAKSIFTTKGAPNVSEKYAHISTEKIIDDMAILGWGVADVKEVKAGYECGIAFENYEDIKENDKSLEIKKQLSTYEFYGLPLKKMKPVDSTQAFFKLKNMQRLTNISLNDILLFYSENNSVYD